MRVLGCRLKVIKKWIKSMELTIQRIGLVESEKMKETMEAFIFQGSGSEVSEEMDKKMEAISYQIIAAYWRITKRIPSSVPTTIALSCWACLLWVE